MAGAVRAGAGSVPGGGCRLWRGLLGWGLGTRKLARQQAPCHAHTDLLARPGRGLVLMAAAQTPHLAQDRVEALALDELHGVVVNAAVFADAEDRHDVGVMQPGRRLGFPPEAL